eukprot:11219573-Lingulodinium_polyedra.AAC.1
MVWGRPGVVGGARASNLERRTSIVRFGLLREGDLRAPASFVVLLAQEEQAASAQCPLPGGRLHTGVAFSS